MYVFHDYTSIYFNVSRFRALAYTTLDKL